jgi:5,10-methylenetetrahydromethanopterin reductase
MMLTNWITILNHLKLPFISGNFGLRLAIGFNADLPVSEILMQAKLAESLGFEGLWMHEHSFGREASSYLGAAAITTKNIRLGFGCLSPFVRNPISIAMMAATLQETSSGRVNLGIGTGFPARLDLMGIDHTLPIATLKETIEICRGIWSGNLLNYSGKVFNLKNVKSLLGPLKTNIPIYIAGWKPQILKLTAKHADGYLAKAGESTKSLGQILTTISSFAPPRSVKEIDLAAYLLTQVAHSKEDALAKARKDPFVAYMLSVQDDYLYEGTGIDPALKKPIAENFFRGNLPAAFGSIKDEMLEAFMIAGTPDQVCDRILEYVKIGLNLPILQPIGVNIDNISAVAEAGSMLIESIPIESSA